MGDMVAFDDECEEELAKLRESIDRLGRPFGKVIAAASYEYWLCLQGMRRASESGNYGMFFRWANAMQRVVLAIAENPPYRYVKEVAKLPSNLA